MKSVRQNIRYKQMKNLSEEIRQDIDEVMQIVQRIEESDSQIIRQHWQGAAANRFFQKHHETLGELKELLRKRNELNETAILCCKKYEEADNESLRRVRSEM